MYQHHKESIANVTDKLKKQDEVLAVLVCGSLAHGFATEVSDVDIMIVIADEAYTRRQKAGQLQYFERESCTYEAGYIDGKYINLEMMSLVATKGSEPARFAFEGAWPTFSRIDNLDKLLARIVRYPVEHKEDNIRHFYAQLEAWKWYCEEALKHKNLYLLNRSVSNLILFAGRMILAHNETLYPYHKWFLRVLAGVADKPADLMETIDILLQDPSHPNIVKLYEDVKKFRDWGTAGINWPSLFMLDVELTWMNGTTSIADR